MYAPPMGKFWTEVKETFKTAAAMDVQKAKDAGMHDAPREYTLFDKPVVCHHCSGTHFFASSVNMASPAAVLFNKMWLGPSATALHCGECGHIDLFGRAPDAKPTST